MRRLRLAIQDGVMESELSAILDNYVTFVGSYVVSQEIYWFETIYGKCFHERTNQRSKNYMRRGVTSNTTYLGLCNICPLTDIHGCKFNESSSAEMPRMNRA